MARYDPYTESDDIKDRWKRYCEELYASQELNVNYDDDADESDEEEPEILLSEVRNAIHHLKNNKSPGLDEVPAELIKYADESGAMLWSFIAFAIRSGKQKPGQPNGKIQPFSLYQRRVMSVSVKTTEQSL